MPAAHETWTVLPHKPIETLADNLWRVQGSLPNMPLPRVATFARMNDGRLIVHNGIALEEPAMKELESKGKPAFLVVPNAYHRLDAGIFKKRYPDLRVYCPAGATKKVEQVVKVDGSYDDFPGDDQVTLFHLDGVGRSEGVMQVKSTDGVTLVFNDLIFNLEHQGGFMGFVSRYVLDSTGGAKVTRIGRFMIVKDKSAVRAHLQRLADTPGLKRIIVSHGAMIGDAAAETLRTIASEV